MLRVRWNKDGKACGLYCGGPTHRGMSKGNVQKFYQIALFLGEMLLEKSKIKEIERTKGREMIDY